MILEHEIALYQPAFSASTQTIISTLTDAIVCEITEERNGIYELYMEYPREGRGAESIAPDTVITAPTSEPRLESSSTVQPFRVYKVERSTGGRLKVYAEHISYQINSMVVPRIIGLDSGNTVSEVLQELEEDAVCGQNHMACPFNLSTDKTISAVYYLPSPRSLRSALMGSEGSILDTFGGGEYVFDWFKIKLCASRGADRGFSVEYGKNLSEANLERDTSGAFTAIFPFWLSGDGKDAQAQYLPYSEDRCVFGAHVSDFAYARILPLDLSDEFENTPTENQLRTRATAYLNENGATGIPQTITVEVVPHLGSGTEVRSGYPPVITITDGQITNVQAATGSGQSVVRLCDTVTVECPPLGISVKAKVVKTVWDAIAERYTALEIGQTKQTLSDTIAAVEEAAEKKVTPNTRLKTASRGISYACAAGRTDGGTYTFGTDILGETGYSPIGAIGYTTGNNDVVLTRLYLGNGNTELNFTVRNVGSVAVSGTLNVVFLFQAD